MVEKVKCSDPDSEFCLKTSFFREVSEKIEFQRGAKARYQPTSLTANPDLHRDNSTKAIQCVILLYGKAH
jgi:hypothetical protein